MTFRYALHIFFAIAAAIATLYGTYFVFQLVLHHGPSEMVMPSIGCTVFNFVAAIVFWFRRYSD